MGGHDKDRIRSLKQEQKMKPTKKSQMQLEFGRRVGPEESSFLKPRAGRKIVRACRAIAQSIIGLM